MTYTYDGTFDGLLSVVFESFRLKAPAERIVAVGTYQDRLFEEPVYVDTRPAWAERVRTGISRRAGEASVKMLYRALLTEQPGVEDLIHYFVREAVSRGEDISQNFRDEKILRLHQLDRRMGRELHRMHAFVRFEQTPDGLYVALIDPDFNVLPLLGDHFISRYPAQQWLIYDTRRHYGLHWDGSRSAFITLQPAGQQRLRQLGQELRSADEDSYRQLWQTYYESVNIPERRNLKLFLQHVPRRYWKYLTEVR